MSTCTQQYTKLIAEDGWDILTAELRQISNPDAMSFTRWIIDNDLGPFAPHQKNGGVTSNNNQRRTHSIINFSHTP